MYTITLMKKDLTGQELIKGIYGALLSIVDKRITCSWLEVIDFRAVKRGQKNCTLSSLFKEKIHTLSMIMILYLETNKESR